tara:strand:- start:396 stop:557 length:162 start_codon:yes stop_codon:yes gene_type:complete
MQEPLHGQQHVSGSHFTRNDLTLGHIGFTDSDVDGFAVFVREQSNPVRSGYHL